MSVSKITQNMISYSNGNLHDINHFMKVYAYAKTIGENEGLDKRIQEQLEVAAILHDIACPLCRKKYGNTNGPLQEKEGVILVKEFLRDSDYSNEFIERIAYLVGHHHTYSHVDGLDYQILLEADYLVNADESHYSKENIQNVLNTVFKTATGISLLKDMYLKQ